LSFHVVKSIAGRFFGLVTKYSCGGQTDGQTDRQTELRLPTSQDRASIAASHAKNWNVVYERSCERKWRLTVW